MTATQPNRLGQVAGLNGRGFDELTPLPIGVAWFAALRVVVGLAYRRVTRVERPRRRRSPARATRLLVLDR